MNKIVNECEIMVNAMQRSAHHAFVLELLRSTNQHCFVNCVRNANIYAPRYINVNPAERFVNDMNLDLASEMSPAKQHKKLFVYNSEHTTTAHARSIFLNPAKIKAIGQSRHSHYVTWVRDPLNNIASLFQSARRINNRLASSGQAAATEVISASEKMINSRNVWVDHWAAAQDKTQGLALISNLWMRDADYREAFFRAVSLQAPPRVTTMTRWGNGSSFSTFQHGQDAPDIEALESRCDHFLDDPDFQAVFADRTFAASIDSFFDAHPQLGALSDRWSRLRKVSIGA